MKKSNTEILASLSKVSDIQVMGDVSWKKRMVCGLGALALSCLFWVGPTQKPDLPVEQHRLEGFVFQSNFAQVAEDPYAYSFVMNPINEKSSGEINPLSQVRFSAIQTPSSSTTLLDKNTLPINTLTAVEAQRIAPFVELGVLDSLPEESKDQFMLRVARSLDDFTERTRHEACSAIMSNPEQTQWRVRLITNRSHVGCIRAVFSEPGFLATNETIHSHPQDSSFQTMFANRADARLRGFSCKERLIVDDKSFSPGDLTNGPGYLVARGRLLYQSEGNIKLIGSIDKQAKTKMLVAKPTTRPGIVENVMHETEVLTVPKNVEEKVPTSCRARGSY